MFFRSLISTNPPNPPLIKGGNYKKLQEKSPFEKGGFRQQCPVRFLHKRNFSAAKALGGNGRESGGPFAY